METQREMRRLFKIAHRGAKIRIGGRRRPGETGYPRRSAGLVVEDDIEERTVHSQRTIILNEAQLPELVHEETPPRPRRPDHVRQQFLTDLGDDKLSLILLAHVSQQQENPGQPFLARIEQLIDQVRLHANVARKEIGREQLSKNGLFVQQADHGFLLDPDGGAVGYRRRRRHAKALTGQATLANEGVGPEHGDDRFFPLCGHYRELDLALEDVEYPISKITLCKEGCAFPELDDGSSVPVSCNERLEIKPHGSFLSHNRHPP